MDTVAPQRRQRHDRPPDLLAGAAVLTPHEAAYLELTGFLVELAGRLEREHHDLIWDRLIRIDLRLRALQAREPPPQTAELWRRRHRVLPGLPGPVGPAPGAGKPGAGDVPPDRRSR
ncbi:hypothetical protein [Skermanella aerolata]|uniref:hypothetical protein n=1 Tax=Skermanella aerolata TaxID=393310 RepID=UPI0011BD8B26|nr:hypothetical protein [Skermanella aerolata]